MKFTAFLLSALVLTTAQDAMARDGLFNDDIIPQSGKIVSLDYDDFYSVPLSSKEKIKVLGNVGYEPDDLNQTSKEVSLLVKYSFSF